MIAADWRDAIWVFSCFLFIHDFFSCTVSMCSSDQCVSLPVIFLKPLQEGCRAALLPQGTPPCMFWMTPCFRWIQFLQIKQLSIEIRCAEAWGTSKTRNLHTFVWIWSLIYCDSTPQSLRAEFCLHVSFFFFFLRFILVHEIVKKIKKIPPFEAGPSCFISWFSLLYPVTVCCCDDQ